jgi:hypothetical protein
MPCRVPLAFAVFLSSFGAAHAQHPQGGGIIYGERHAFSVIAPAGWVLDNQAGQPDGLVAVFYPQGGSWTDSKAVMYVNVVVPDSGHEASVPDVIREDSLRFSREVPSIRITRAAAVRTDDGRSATILRFAGDPRGTFEAVAYVAERSVTPIIVLSARSKATFDSAWPAFTQLVHSYHFFTSDVRYPGR